MGKLFSDLLPTGAIAEPEQQVSFDWFVVTPAKAPAPSLAGIKFASDRQIGSLPRPAALVVLGGRTLRNDRRRKMTAVLSREVAPGRPLVDMADAVILMAEAGILAGNRCAVHRGDTASFAERFTSVEVRVPAFVRARHLTVEASIATADFLLEQNRSEQGNKVAQTVADQITHRSVRDGAAPRTASQARHVGALSATAGISICQLERQFCETFSPTPMQFLLRLRLERARDLIAQMNKPLDDIAELTGFSSAPFFFAPISHRLRNVALWQTPDSKAGAEVACGPFLGTIFLFPA